MKKTFIFVLLSFLVFLLIGCPPPKIICPQGPEGKERILPKCEKLIKYDSVNLTLPTLSISIPAIATDIKVGGATWKKDQLQKASDAALALDNGNYLICNALLSRMSVCKNDAECYKVITEYYNNLTIENQFITFVESNSPEAVDLWLRRYFKEEVEVNPIVNKPIDKPLGNVRAGVVLGGEVFDDVIPVHKYVLKENIKAQPASTFLK
jgi:hypothetical protein